MTRVLFVCMGNICRSPLAEGVFANLLNEAGLDGGMSCDSAGTSAYHVGDPPDPRAVSVARRAGIDISHQRARQVIAEDFEEFDLILAMDEDNLAILARRCPDQHSHKLGLFLSYTDDIPLRELPDPYYGGEDGFERCLDLVQQAAQGLVRVLRSGRSGEA